MPNWTPPLTLNQQMALAIIPKFTASFSLAGSTFIVIHILTRNRPKQRVYHRLLLGLSVMDMISSFKSFLSTWPIPKGTTYGAVGTTQTCTCAGFFGHGSSLASALYNGSLTLYYVLTIIYGWKQERFQKLLEPWVLHAIPLCVGWSTAIAGLPLLLYNAIGWTCWIGPLPLGCKQTHEYGYTTCERGDNAYVYRWAFFHGFIWATFILVTVAMIWVYRSVRQREQATELYRFSPSLPQGSSSGSPRQQQNQSRRVANQAMLYVAAYYVTWTFPVIGWSLQQWAGKTYTPLLFLQAFFVPLQGFFNALVYVRPRLIRYRQKHPELSCWQALVSGGCRMQHINLDRSGHERRETSFDFEMANSRRISSMVAVNGEDPTRRAIRTTDSSKKRKDFPTANGLTARHAEQVLSSSSSSPGNDNGSVDSVSTNEDDCISSQERVGPCS